MSDDAKTNQSPQKVRQRRAPRTPAREESQATYGKSAQPGGKTIRLVPGQITHILEPGFDLPLAVRVGSQRPQIEELESVTEERRQRAAVQGQVEAFLATLPDVNENFGTAERYAARSYENPKVFADQLQALGDVGIDLAKRLFRERSGFPLRTHLIHRLPHDPDFVRLLALLEFGYDKGREVRVGQAIIPDRVNDADVLPAIESAVKARHRDHFVKRYGKAFRGLGLGHDEDENNVLREHLERAWGGVLGFLTNDDDAFLKRALALIDHDLTTAEKIYFDSLAIRGTHTKAVIDAIQETWKQGFDKFDELVQDWEKFVHSRRGWKDQQGKPFADVGLKEALISELSFEDRDLVLVVFREYEKAKQGGAEKTNESDEDKLWRSEDLQVETALQTIQVAGSALSIFTNDDQVQQSILTITQIWDKRIARARLSRNKETIQQYTRLWERQRKELLAWVRDPRVASQSELQTKKTRLLLTGTETLLDQVWAECQIGNYPEAVKLVTNGWIQGQMAQLNQEAKQPKEDQGEVVRPTIVLELLLPSTDTQYWRFVTLARDTSDRPSARAGASRLYVELGGKVGQGLERKTSRADSELTSAYEFLAAIQKSDPKLQSDVLRAFVELIGFTRQSKDPTDDFVTFLEFELNFEQATQFEKLRALLLPPKTAEETREQLHRERNARETGIAAGTLRFLTDAYAEVTGERTRDALDRSVEAIDDLVNGSGEKQVEANDAPNAQVLLDQRTGDFRDLLGRYSSEQAVIVDFVAGAVELAFELGLSYVTGGQGVASVISSIISTLANQFTQEALLGENYQLYSPSNVSSVVKNAVGAALFDVLDLRGKIENALELEHTALFRRYLESAEESGFFRNLALGAGKENQAKVLLNAFQNATGGVADGLITTFTQFMTDALLSEKYPTPSAMALELERISIYSISRALHARKTAFANPGVYKEDTLDFAKRLDANFTFKLWVKELEGTGKKIAEVLASDTSNQTVWDMIERVATPEIKGFITSYLKAYASAKGQDRAASARLSEIKEILGNDKAAYEDLARALAEHLDLGVAFERHQAGGEAQQRGVLNRAQTREAAGQRPIPRTLEDLAATPYAAELKQISANLIEYAGAKKQQPAREAILAARKLFSEEGVDPRLTRQWIGQVLAKSRDAADAAAAKANQSADKPGITAEQSATTRADTASPPRQQSATRQTIGGQTAAPAVGTPIAAPTPASTITPRVVSSEGRLESDEQVIADEWKRLSQDRGVSY